MKKPFFISNFIRKLTNIMHLNSIINQDKLNYALKIHRSYISWLKYPFSENLISKAYSLYATQYKTKKIMLKTLDFLDKNNKKFTFLLTNIQKTFILSISVIIYLVFLWIMNYWNYIDEFIDILFIIKNKEKSHSNNRLKGIEYWLARITSKHVLYSENINKKTAKLLNEVCNKPKINIYVNKNIKNVLLKENIIKKTENITQEFLHKNLLYEEFLYIKFKKLIISQMRKENLRQLLCNTLVDFSKNNMAYNVFVNNFASALRNEGVVENFVGGCKGKLHDMLENEYYTGLASQKLRNIKF